MDFPKVVPATSTKDKQLSYEKSQKEDLDQLISTLEISELHKHSLRSRWLDQVLWMSKKASHCQRWYIVLRLIAIVGALIVPALVGLNPATFGDNDKFAANLIVSATFGLSLLVAISVATEEFFHFGDRWRHYRSISERLKIEGWQFFQLAGPYQEFNDRMQAYSLFATRTESMLQQEVDVFITEIAKEKKKEQAEKANGENK
jgi:Protein of unknown function (DUF4231)